MTHNRNEDGETEEMNTASFSLYLESNTDGAVMTIFGNTVPDNPEESGTMAEGLYSGKAQKRGSKCMSSNQSAPFNVLNQGVLV